MSKLLARLGAPIAIIGCATFYSGGALGQQVPVKGPMNSVQENPFDYILALAETPNLANTSSTAARVARPLKVSRKSADLQTRKPLRGGQAKSLIENLTLKYGPPKSIRGQNYVWDIANPDAGGRQAKIVTIIVKLNTSGRSELVMDRDKGEDGRATYAAARRAKQVAAAPKKQIQKQVLDPRLISND